VIQSMDTCYNSRTICQTCTDKVIQVVSHWSGWCVLVGHFFVNRDSSRATNQFAWHPSGEIHMSVGQGSVAMDTRNHKQETEDVEVMSTDSSSSSSSDSQ
jgi:hypothetical protein